VLVYPTPKFVEQLQGIGDVALRQRVQDFVGRIQSAPDRWEADKLWQFRDRSYLKQRINRIRILGRFINVDDQWVCCLYAVVHRGSHEYEHSFLVQRDTGTIESTFSLEAVRTWIASQSETTRGEPLAHLPPELEAWLEPVTELTPSGNSRDVNLFESELWCRASARPEIQLRYESLNALLLKIVDGGPVPGNDGWLEESTHNGDVRVRYGWVDGQSVFLHTVELSSTVQREGHPDQPPASLEFRRRSRRAYPAYFLGDLDLWCSVQKGETSNLSLSPEEQEILEMIGQDGPEGTGHGLPMFIDGRAGSGKSTMLMHIFAGLYQRRSSKGLDGRLVFLTYGRGLREKAREGVRNLLVTNHSFLMGDADVSLDGLFVDFRKFLMEILGPESRSRFVESQHILFHDFKMALLGRKSRLPAFKGQARHISPEVAWFVIRSLIKGASVVPTDHDDVRAENSQEFDELDRKDRVVSAEVFEEIYTTVYERWYAPQMEAHGLWDDQDLVGAALNAHVAQENRVAGVVCDEAQDFTRRELRLLVRMSEFAQYDCSSPVRKVRLPFILAGDPMQSISPTGFRWEQFTSAMYEEVATFSGGERNVGIPREVSLQLNYRSTAEIVKISNAIQQLRAELLKIRGVKPQVPWAEYFGASQPKKYILKMGLSVEEFAELTKDATIIVPCEESAESAFIAGDEVLSSIYGDLDSGQPAYNVFSSSAAKGLEFSRVVVYGFGSAMPPIPSDLPDLGEDDEKLYELKHFFNKLYVAVTRAEQQLYIVDTVDGDKRLWSLLEEDEVLRRSSRASSNAFVDRVDPLLLGTSEDFRSVKESRPEDNARRLEQSGMENGTPVLLRQAAGFFRRAGKSEEASRCEAHALRLEQRFVEAAEAFKRLGLLTESWRASWLAGDWPALAGLGSEMMGLGISPPLAQRTVVQVMTSEKPGRNLVLQACQQIADSLREADLDLDPIESWILAGRRVVELFPPTGDLDIKVAESLDILAEFGVVAAGQRSAEVNFALGNWRQAAERWDRFGGGNRATLAMARARAIGLPEGLRVLSAENLHRQIVGIWDEFGKPSGEEWLQHVVDSLMKVNPPRHEEAISVSLRIGDVFGALQTFERASWQDQDALVRSRTWLAIHCSETPDPSIYRRFIRQGAFGGSRQRADRPRVLGLMIECLVQAADESKWNLKTEDEFLAEILDDARRSGAPIHPLVLGAGFELAGHRRRALEYYETLIEVPEVSVREGARRRWLWVKQRQIDGSDQGIQKSRYEDDFRKSARSWRIDPKKIDAVPNLRGLFRLEPDARREMNAWFQKGRDEAESVFLASGSNGPIRWERRDGNLILSWEDSAIYVSIRIDIGKQRVDGVQVTTGDASETFQLGGATVTVDFSQGTLLIESEAATIRGVLN